MIHLRNETIDENKFIGKICGRSHEHKDTGMTLRYKISGNYVKCAAGFQKKYNKKNREKVTDYYKLYRKTHKKETAAANKKWDDKNKEHLLEYRKKNKHKTKLYSILYRIKNKEVLKERGRRYRDTHKEDVRHRKAKRRADKLKRTPSYANLKKIKIFYQTSQLLSELYNTRYHVDHIIPLQGKLVSGLHHEGNLQILTEKENLEKGNKFTPIII